MSRSAEDRQKFRDWAKEYIAGKEYLCLDNAETVGNHNALNWKTGGGGKGDICGVLVDNKSGAGGKTEVVGKTPIITGPMVEAQYSSLNISPGEDCWTYGSASLIYIRYK